MKKRRRGKLSIKMRITLWYAALLMLICAAIIWALAAASQRAALAYYEETLTSASLILLDEMEVEHGLLEIDDDIDDVPNVYASLFDEAGNLIYGRKWVTLPFEESSVRIVHEKGHSWYVYDTHVAVPGYDSMWLRMHMSSDVSDSVRASVVHEGFLVLAALAALALMGGYLITARAFAPVQQMNAVARTIARGEDLSARIPLGESGKGDELYALGRTINDMFARLERAFRREMQFTADAAHELRTPLNRIVTQGEYALSRETGEEKDEAVARMIDTAHGMSALVSQLLLLARMDAGQMQREDVCDLKQMADEIAQDMLPLMEERGMSLRLETAPCTLRVNRMILSRMMINLLDNAVRYGKEGGEIGVFLQAKGEQIEFTVKNEGDGLTREEAERVFERFWRCDSARTTQGTGIGLSLVRSGAKAHGGSVQVSSVQGAWTSFTVTLPQNEEK